MGFADVASAAVAHLVDHVLPEQPIRQWVLSFPYPLRFLFATRPAVLSQVLAIVYRAISTFLIRRAGLCVGAGARTGAVTFIQRFGSALSLEKQSQYPRCASHCLASNRLACSPDRTPSGTSFPVAFKRLRIPATGALSKSVRRISSGAM